MAIDSEVLVAVSPGGTSSMFGRGTLAARPALTAAQYGYMYFATDYGISGAPIWWDGTRWVDAGGTVVP